MITILPGIISPAIAVNGWGFAEGEDATDCVRLDESEGVKDSDILSDGTEFGGISLKRKRSPPLIQQLISFLRTLFVAELLTGTKYCLICMFGPEGKIKGTLTAH